MLISSMLEQTAGKSLSREITKLATLSTRKRIMCKKQHSSLIYINTVMLKKNPKMTPSGCGLWLCYTVQSVDHKQQIIKVSSRWI